jgi:hypothetical protein
MRRRTRNALVEILLDTLKNPADARLEFLRVLCEASSSEPLTKLTLPDVIRRAQQETHRSAATLLEAAVRLATAGGPLRARHRGTGQDLASPRAVEENAAEWLIGLAPEVLADLAAVQQRVRVYHEVLTELEDARQAFSGPEPLRWGFAQGAACFNAGLFFEAHEILEGYWRVLPGGGIKLFVQGVIQISAGLHHAGEGRFVGAVNLLGRGLEKTAGWSGTVLGLDCGAFFPQIRSVRDQLLARGPLGTAGARPLGIPHMPINLER